MAPHRFTLAEDDPDTLFLIHWMLKEAFPDSSFATFSSAEDALAHILQAGTDILITDHAMGRMTGCEMIRKLRQSGSAIPIIMISGNWEAEEDARQAGASDFVLKEMDTKKLERHIRKLFGQ
jgi:CheY-like chemotaxis protein